MTATLSQLAAAFAAAKDEEARATELRRAIAAQIQAMTGHDAEGSKTYKDGDWRVTVKAPLITSMDWQKWEETKLAIPEQFWPVEMKPSLDMKGVKWLYENNPDAYAVVAQAMTIKPGAVQVTVKLEKGE